MAKNLFNAYIWLVDTIQGNKRITFEEIDEKWQRNSLSEGKPLPLRTFHNWRQAIEEMFDINIECNKQGGYYYYIENADDMNKGGVRAWLLNTFAVNNLIYESHHLKRRILFEQIPSGRQFLSPIIEAMRDGVKVEITYQSFWSDKQSTFTLEPYCVKVFRQRWYLLGNNANDLPLRIYGLDRIKNLRATGEKFTYPSDFDTEEYFCNLFGVIANDQSKKCETIRLKVTNNQQLYIRSLPLHHSQQEVETTDAYSIFEYHLKPTFDFRQEILSHGSDVEVLAPQNLRKEMAEEVDSMKKMYKK